MQTVLDGRHPEAVDQLIAAGGSDLFFLRPHRLIARTIELLRACGQDVNAAFVQGAMARMSHADASVNGGSALRLDSTTEIKSSVFHALTMEPWERITDAGGSWGGWATNLERLVAIGRQRQALTILSEAQDAVRRPGGAKGLPLVLGALRDRLEAIAAPPAAAPVLALRSAEDRLRDAQAPPLMVVDGILPAGGLGALVAMPGVGKTLMALELAEGVAARGTFAGRSVLRGVVIYAATDAQRSTERRMLALSPEAARNVYSVGELRLPQDMETLRATIAATNAQGIRVRLVVVDTWDSTRTHSTEGWAGQDAALEEILRGLRTIAVEHELAAVLVHHGTRAENGRARGSVVFDARCDWIATLEQSSPGEPLVLTSTKCRDGECGAVGHWLIRAAPIPSGTVPVLDYQGAYLPSDRPSEADDRTREQVLLRLIHDRPDLRTVRDLATASGIPRSSVSRAIKVLTDTHMIDGRPPRLTKDGLVLYSKHVVPSEKRGTRFGTSVPGVGQDGQKIYVSSSDTKDVPLGQNSGTSVGQGALVPLSHHPIGGGTSGTNLETTKTIREHIEQSTREQAPKDHWGTRSEPEREDDGAPF